MDFYAFAKGVVSGVLKPLYRIEVIGTEHFPKEGGVLLCANHISNLDPPRRRHYSATADSFYGERRIVSRANFKNAVAAITCLSSKAGNERPASVANRA